MLFGRTSSKPCRMLLSGLVAMLSMVAAAACTGSDGSEGGGKYGTLNVVTVIPNHLLFIVVEAADRLGTWDDSGLTVNVIDGSSPTAGQTMASGEAEIGLVDGNRAVANIAEGLEAKIVGSCYSPWAQQYLVGADYSADSLRDLKGANFGISGEGSAGHYSVFKLAESMGWSEGDYKITSLGDISALTAALESGSIDAFAWSSTTVFSLQEQGKAKILGKAEKFVGPNLFESFTVRDDTLEENPEAVKVFFEKYYETVKRLQKNPQLAIDIMVEDWDVDPVAARRSVKAELPKLSTDGTVRDDELSGVAKAAEFSTGTPVKDPGSIYTYWGDL